MVDTTKITNIEDAKLKNLMFRAFKEWFRKKNATKQTDVALARLTGSIADAAKRGTVVLKRKKRGHRNKEQEENMYRISPTTKLEMHVQKNDLAKRLKP